MAFTVFQLSLTMGPQTPNPNLSIIFHRILLAPSLGSGRVPHPMVAVLVIADVTDAGAVAQLAGVACFSCLVLCVFRGRPFSYEGRLGGRSVSYVVMLWEEPLHLYGAAMCP